MRSVPLVSVLVRASPRKRLWLAGAGLAVFLLTFVIANGVVRRDRAVTRADLGHDFLAFYTAAEFVRDGRYQQLYDLDAVRRAEQATAHAAGIDLGSAFGPWWNPPFYALALEPLARLPYGVALDVWRWINLASLVAAAALLGWMIPAHGRPAHALPAGGETPVGYPDIPADRRLGRRPRRHEGRHEGHEDGQTAGPHLSGRRRFLFFVSRFVPSWSQSHPTSGSEREWVRRGTLILLLLVTSMPFIQAIGHAQNTCTSLLLLSVTVALWRADRPVWAGVVGGLLFYKPQLAAVVAGVMVIDLGWTAALGLAITGVALLAVTAVALPGSLADWLHRLPANVRFMQVEHAYLWDRHVTIKAFWRLLLQGTAAGQARALTTALTNLFIAAVAVPLAWAALRARGDRARRDRLIAATVAAMPLLMPFYFDYDLLLLAVPMTLYAGDRRRQRGLTACWALLCAWMFVNAPVASHVHFGGAAVVLAGVAILSIRRVGRGDATSVPIVLPMSRARAVAA